MSKQKILLEVFVSLLYLLFLYAGLSQLFNFASFSDHMHNQAFPDIYKPVVVYVVPVSELLLALLLMFIRTRRVALWGALVLLLLFTGYIVLVLFNFYSRVPCSCGGILSYAGWFSNLLFNLFFILVTSICIVVAMKNSHTVLQPHAQQGSMLKHE